MPVIKSTSPPDSPRSCQKLGGGGDGGANTDDDDRISGLPDSVIGEILSFLPTKNAVATEILSKRWKSLWTLAARNLDFCCPKNYTGSVEHFVEFVNHVLLSHKHGCFQSLSLTWRTGCNPDYVANWIGDALDRNVCELFVCAEVSELPIQLQSSLFSSDRLKSLELNCNICIPSSSEIVFNLPKLERLKLISAYFENFEAIGEILKGCPVLKYLIIHMDVGKMVQHGYLISSNDVALHKDGHEIRCLISSASVTQLEIRVNAFSSSPTPLEVLWCAVLDVPSLNYLKLDGFFLSISIQQETLACLEEANIEIHGPLYKEPLYCNSLVKAFSAFGCAHSLALHDEVIRGLSDAPVKMKTKFDRLLRLEVSTYDCYYWSSLLDFLRLSDNLLAFYVHKYGDPDVDDEPHDNANSDEEKPDLVPVCLSKSLRFAVIGGYSGHSDELAMVEYIIKNASVLKILTIGFEKSIHNDFKRKFELIQEICAFPRKSTVCEVSFHDCC